MRSNVSEENRLLHATAASQREHAHPGASYYNSLYESSRRRRSPLRARLVRTRRNFKTASSTRSSPPHPRAERAQVAELL